MGQKIGLLGKEGGSGGWSHLHFEIKSRQPSGKWGTQEGYAFLWQAATREQALDVIAVARPHHFVRAGDKVVLDGSKSWSRSGPPARFDWTFSDGTTASGPRAEKVYAEPGAYSEILKVTDAQGRSCLRLRDRPGPRPGPSRTPAPTIHAAFYPTTGPEAGRPGHVQGPHVPRRPRRRPGTLGLRRRHRPRLGPLRRQRRAARPRRLRRDHPPVRQGRRLPRQGRTGERAGPQGHRPPARARGMSANQIKSERNQPQMTQISADECKKK